MACDYETEFRCGDGEHNLLKKILGRLAQLVGLAGGGGGVGDTVTLTVSDIEIGAVEIKDGDTDARAKVITACPDPADRGLVVRNIPCGTQAISAASLPLPTGAMTEASFLARTNTLGQKNMSGSMPVVLAADQPPIIFTLNGASIIGVCPGEFDQGLVVRNIPCGTQAISAATLPLPAGAATEATLSNINLFTEFFLPDISNNLVGIYNLLPSLGFDAIIRTVCPSGADPALAVRNIPCGTQAISAASLPLPTGAATEATLASRLSESAFTARINTQGQKTMAESTPVVLASDHSPIRITHAFDATYGSFTAELTLGTAIGKNRILSFFHPVGVTLNYEIIKIILFFKNTHTVGVGQYKIQFTTVESATGTVLTPQQYHRGDANTGASVRSATTADGTLVGNPFIGYTKSLTPITGDPFGAAVPIYEHPGSPEEKPITLRASTAEGILVFQDVTATLTTAPIVACRVVWREKL